MRIYRLDDEEDYGRGAIDFDGHMNFRDEMSIAEERAFKAGCKHGYRKAMEEAQGGYGERGGMRRGAYGDIYYRDDDMSRYDTPMYEERRRRDSRGRYM